MRRPVGLGLLAALLASIAVIHLMPPTDDFNRENPFWNGLSAAAERYQLTPIRDLGALANATDAPSLALLILGPSKPFGPVEVRAIKEFVSKGGLIVVADDFGTANELLEALGIPLRLNGSLLVDPLFKERASYIPRVACVGSLPGVEEAELVLNYATVVSGSGLKPLALSSPFSFLDVDGDLELDKGEPRGPFVVAAEMPYGRGTIIVVSDSSLLINSMLNLAANAEFAEHLLAGREVLLDESHWVPSPFSAVKSAVASALSVFSVPEVRYSLAALVALLVSKLELKPTKPRPSRLEEILRSHPDWDRDVLAKLEEELAHGT